MYWIERGLRGLFYFIVRVLVLVLLGMNVRRRELLPVKGPAIVVANHNSHLDTMVLISLFPLLMLPQIRPVGAADYFLRNRLLGWFATKIVGILPIERGKASRNYDPLEQSSKALEREDILILFPEGSRGEPEEIAQFKKGIAHLAERYPQVPVIPVFMHGLGKALPKGECVLVPFFCDVFVGEAMHYEGDRQQFMEKLTQRFQQLGCEEKFAVWE